MVVNTTTTTVTHTTTTVTTNFVLNMVIDHPVTVLCFDCLEYNNCITQATHIVNDIFTGSQGICNKHYDAYMAECVNDGSLIGEVPSITILGVNGHDHTPYHTPSIVIDNVFDVLVDQFETHHDHQRIHNTDRGQTYNTVQFMFGGQSYTVTITPTPQT